MDNESKGLTSITSLTDIKGLSDVQAWGDAYGDDHVILGDPRSDVWNQYSEPDGRPQYIVFDRDMNIVFKGQGSGQHKKAQDAVLAEL